VLDEPAIATTIVGIKTPAQAMEDFAARELPPFERLAARWHLNSQVVRSPVDNSASSDC
jgi:hypothetical protein